MELKKSLSIVFTILTFDVVMFMCFNLCSCVSVLYTLEQFGGTACVNVRISWWWHSGSAETYRKESVYRLCYFLLHEKFFDWLNLTSCTVHTILRLEITNQRGVMCQKAVTSIYKTSLQITSNVSVQNSTLLTVWQKRPISMVLCEMF